MLLFPFVVLAHHQPVSMPKQNSSASPLGTAGRSSPDRVFSNPTSAYSPKRFVLATTRGLCVLAEAYCFGNDSGFVSVLAEAFCCGDSDQIRESGRCGNALYRRSVLFWSEAFCFGNDSPHWILHTRIWSLLPFSHYGLNRLKPIYHHDDPPPSREEKREAKTRARCWVAIQAAFLPEHGVPSAPAPRLHRASKQLWAPSCPQRRLRPRAARGPPYEGASPMTTASAAARTSSRAGPEAAARPPPAQTLPVRRHTPSYERMMANACDAPPTPISCRRNRGGRGLMQARQAIGAASSPSSRLAKESECRSSAHARSRAASRDSSAVLAARYKQVWGMSSES